MAEKQPYIRQRVLSNIEASRKSRESNNEGKGLNYDEHKFTSKNFDKLMEQRGKSKEEAQEIKSSFNKWAGENKDPNLSQDVTVKRSRPSGDKGYVYSTKGGERPASGNYVGAEKYNKVNDAKSKYATPTSNKMTQREEVRVHGNQIRGTVAPQPGWSEEARKNGDNVERKGGGTQIYTNGGYESNAVQSKKGTTYDMKSSDNSKSKVDEYGVDLSKAEKSQGTSREHTRGR